MLSRDEIIACTDGRVLDGEWISLRNLKRPMRGGEEIREEIRSGNKYKWPPEYHKSLDLIHEQEEWLFGQVGFEKYVIRLIQIMDHEKQRYSAIHADAMTRLKALILTMMEGK